MTEGSNIDEESSADVMTRSDSHGEAMAPRAIIALALPHCPWIPERAQSMLRLTCALGVHAHPDGGGCLNDPTGASMFRAFGHKAANDVWSEQVFGWLASSGADICVQVQDDAEVSPDFWAIVRALFEAVPAAGIFGLHVTHPLTPALSEQGIRLFTTADALVGVCWAIRGETMREFVEWRRTQLLDGWRAPVPPRGAPSLTEDTMIGLFAMATGRKVYHPVIAPVDHDTSMSSVYGNDEHENRRPRVAWHHVDPDTQAAMTEPSFWTGRIPHLGRFYEATPHLARRWVRGFDDEAFMRAQRDQGNEEKRRLQHARLARRPERTIASVMICMPIRDQIAALTAQTVWATLRDEAIDASCSHDMWAVNMRTENLVRGRSRMLREAYESGVDFAWFLDSDVSCSPLALRGMLAAAASGKHIVAAPYPRRDTLPIRYRLTLPGGRLGQVDETGCVPLIGAGLGCTLISRESMRVMLERYGSDPALVFDDPIEERGPKVPTVALFQLMVRDRTLHGEDSSFYLRAIDAGLQPWLYLGPGAPAVHHGEFAYAGDVEAFGVKHVRATTPGSPIPSENARTRSEAP